MLEALTPRYPYAWHLIAPTCKQPAFFQPPADSTADWTLVGSPAAIDAIRPVKEFDVKFGPVATVNLDQWMFTIINLQTTTASNSPRYAQTSRMNGGYSSRLFVGVNGRPGQRFVRDVRLLLLHRNEMMSAYAKSKGICLTWLAPWGHVIPKSRLDPWFLDTPRRVRLVEGGAMLTWARGLRTLGKEAGSLAGDPWAPTQKAKTISVKGLTYRTIAPILLGDEGIEPSLLQCIHGADSDPVEIKFSVLTGGMPAQTDGFHVRIIPVPRPIRSLLARRDQNLAKATKERIDTLSYVQKVIYGAIMHGFSAFHSAQRHAASSVATILQSWFAGEDSRFFGDLWDEIQAANRLEVRASWTRRMLDDALIVVRAGCDLIPKTETYWAARATAEQHFYRATWKLRNGHERTA